MENTGTTTTTIQPSTSNTFNYLEAMQEEASKQKAIGNNGHSLGACPACGHCPHCGRGGYRTYPNYPQYVPYWMTNAVPMSNYGGSVVHY